MLKFVILCFAIGVALGSPAVEHRHRHGRNLPEADEVCYDKYGCFSNSAPWSSALRPLSALPMRPEEIQTRFLLYTRENPDEAEELLIGKDAILQFSPFDGAKRTVFVIHGWTDNGNSAWVKDTKDALLEREDLNVLVVDWGPGAKKSYLKGVGNIRLVGAMTAMFIDFVVEKAAVKVADVHLIGQSLGAHAASYAGSRVPGIGRITALDPTAPYFEGTDHMVRIDPTDALFVEGVHTNSEAALDFGLGIAATVGHVDIYPNGGKSQPGCKDLLGNLVTSIIDLIVLDFQGAIGTYACSHARVHDYWAESLKNAECPFVAHSCEDYASFQDGNCRSFCETAGSCQVIGFQNDKLKNSATGKFFLHTDKAASYCVHESRAETIIAAEQDKISHGELTIKLRQEDGTTSDSFVIAKGAIYATELIGSWIEVPSSFMPSVTNKVQLVLHYKRTGLIPGNDPKFLSLNALTLTFLDKDLAQQTKHFTGVTLEAGTDMIIPELS